MIYLYDPLNDFKYKVFKDYTSAENFLIQKYNLSKRFKIRKNYNYMSIPYSEEIPLIIRTTKIKADKIETLKKQIAPFFTQCKFYEYNIEGELIATFESIEQFLGENFNAKNMYEVRNSLYHNGFEDKLILFRNRFIFLELQDDFLKYKKHFKNIKRTDYTSPYFDIIVNQIQIEKQNIDYYINSEIKVNYHLLGNQKTITDKLLDVNYNFERFGFSQLIFENTVIHFFQIKSIYLTKINEYIAYNINEFQKNLICRFNSLQIKQCKFYIDLLTDMKCPEVFDIDIYFYRSTEKNKTKSVLPQFRHLSEKCIKNYNLIRNFVNNFITINRIEYAKLQKFGAASELISKD